MTIAEIQQEILRMKKEQDVCILAHAYQRFLWPECTGVQKRLQRCDYVRRAFYGRNLQDFKPEEESMAC